MSNCPKPTPPYLLLEPEKEPIKFVVDLDGAPEELIQLVQSIKEVGEQFLYHWKTFPIVIPNPALAAINNGPSDSYSGNDGSCTLARKSAKVINVKDLFVPPSFDELDAVAVDSKGETKRLTRKQLDSLRERGEFEVPSLNFPGQHHKWRLSEFLQKGRDRTRDSLLDDLSFGLRFLVVTAKARILSHFFSVLKSVHSLVDGLLKLLDILVGIPSLQAHNLDARVHEERCRHLVAELVTSPDDEDSSQHLTSFVRKQLKRLHTEKLELTNEILLSKLSIPYQFITPNGQKLDLRLFNRDLMKKALPHLVLILEKETRGWFLHFREKLINRLKCEKMPDEEIEKAVNQAVMKEYLTRVYNSIQNNEELQALGEGIPQLLIDQAQSIVLMYRAIDTVRAKLTRTKDLLCARIKYSHAILSRIGAWLREQLRQTEARFIEENKWSGHEEAIALCTGHGLHQTLYFLQRDLTFMREREPVLLKELRKVKTPTRTFQWPTQIWFPQNWVVKRNFQGQSENIPTVFSSTATSITTPRSDPNQPVFLVEKEVIRSSSTRWPLWRWINYTHRTWSWAWNIMFFFGIFIPWCSPLGIRALVCIEPFYSHFELSQVNGTLFPRKFSLTPTLCSRLLHLCRHISKSRTYFETKPDTGFIGKGLTRHVNRVWNYLIKGVLGCLVLTLVFPVACILTTIVCLLLALTAVIWVPLVTLALHLGMALVYDLDCPDPGFRNRYCVILEALLVNIFLQGLVQPVLALLIACCFCPLACILCVSVGLVRYWLRLVWDTGMFYGLIKKRGRVPACDSFIVKRIAGPGLASNYFFQVRPEQALAAFEAKLELDELLAYQHQTESRVLQPQKDFAQFVEACFGPFSATLAKNGPYKELEKEAETLMASLHEKLDRRKRELMPGLSPSLRSKVKLTTIELKIAIQQAALMLERFYPSHVFARMGPDKEEELWELKGLARNDWAGLAGLIYADIFSLDFLTPLDDSDTKFKLEPDSSIDLSRFTEMVRGAGGLDLLGPIYAPRGNIQVNSPYLEVAAFNPRSNIRPDKNCWSSKNHNPSHRVGGGVPGSGLNSGGVDPSPDPSSDRRGGAGGGERRPVITCWRPWKRNTIPYSGEKLLIPLPLPHPARIAVTIYNRDTDDVIDLDSELTQQVLRAIEETCTDCQGEMNKYLEDNSMDSVESQSSIASSSTFNWRQGEWNSATRRKLRSTNVVRVDLASPEDVTLDTDSSRVVFSTYGTTV
uniref:Uncharacterized protein n=1 Tax=Cacopsylla melanoneura TaxID=428564 RepID=A0A8D8Y4T6_9HEMI